MTDSYRVEANRLAADAGQFDGLADRAGTIHGELRTVLDSVGECWGTDDVGRSFAAAHNGPADGTLGGLHALPGKLGDLGFAFTESAKTYRGTDETGARDFGAVTDV